MPAFIKHDLRIVADSITRITAREWGLFALICALVALGGFIEGM